MNRDNTTYVVDGSRGDETGRLLLQDRLVTNHLTEGLLPGTLDPAGTHRILDVACGPGGWALDMAFTYPHIEVVGVDISTPMIEYARAQASVQGLNNSTFEVMDVTRPMAFPDASFDFINARFLFGFMLPHAWPALLNECKRLLRPGGALRLTETEIGITSSPAFGELSACFTQALKVAGQSFSCDGRHVGITPVLAPLLRQAGYQKLTIRADAFEWSQGTALYEKSYQDTEMAFYLLQPFLVKTGVISQEAVGALYEQVLEELRVEDFYGLGYVLSVVGYTPLL